MKTNDNQYYIYLRAINQKVTVTKEQFDDYYRDINAYRKQQQRHGRCVCPPSKRLLCDMECGTCPYQTSGDLSSLDAGVTDDDGNEATWLDLLQTERPDLQVPDMAEQIAQVDYLKTILVRLDEIMPQAAEIGRLRQQGLSDEAIAAQIGTGRKTYLYRLKKARQALEKEFPEFF